ncbi:MAG: hypothetical protein ACYTEQ_22190, partial [Planctomycetota bacterium]
QRLQRFLPPTLRLRFDVQDDFEDAQQADIADTRSQARERDIVNGVIDVRIAREQMVEDGELTEAQFAELELREGRLPDGGDVLTLFVSRDGQTQGLLAVDAEGDPLDVADNPAALWLPAIDKQVRLAQEVAVNGPNASIRKKARQAVAALERLRALYEEPGQEPGPVEMDEEEADEGTEDVELDDEEKAQSDAPNYRRSEIAGKSCGNCLFDVGDNRCDLFDFIFRNGFICDAWETDED